MAGTPTVLPPLPSEAVDAANAFPWRGSPLREGIGLALSGGGFRAMLFHTGALLRMNELGLLAKTERIASVSGGSITAGLLAVQWTRFGKPDAHGAFPAFAATFLPTMLAFAKAKIDILDVAIGLLPFTSAAERIADSYDEHLFHGVTLQRLPPGPEFVFCATNMATGVMWRFTKAYAGDYVVGFVPDPAIRLATAVAASSAFPPFLSPLTLDVAPDAFKDWPVVPGETPIDGRPYRDKILLCDGGVYDNHGVEPIVKSLTTNLVSDGGAPFARMTGLHTDWLSQLRRVLDVEDNQVRALRRRDLLARFKRGTDEVKNGVLPAASAAAGARLGAYWGIDSNPLTMAVPDALTLDPAEIERLAHLPTRLSDLGNGVAEKLINWGYAIADRSLRAHYHSPVALPKVPPRWPFP